MVLTLSLFVLLGTGGQAISVRPSPGQRPQVMNVQPGLAGGFGFVQRGFIGFGHAGLLPGRRPQPTRNVSPPPPLPPAHLPLANLPPSSDAPDVLLAVRGGNIYAARSFRVEGGILRYRTNYGAEAAVPLEALDLGRTRLLNADRPVSLTDLGKD